MNAWQIFWESFSNWGTIKTVLVGLQNTAIIAVFGLLLGFLIGCVLATVKMIPSKSVIATVFKRVCDVYIAVFRGTPMMVQLLLFHFGVFAAVSITPVIEVTLIFGLNSGAYVAEIIRGGINSVDKGQMEAGRTLGLSFPVTMVRIVIPQAVKNVVPTLGNEFISLLKETSIVSVVGLADLTRAFRAIANSTYEYFVPYIVLALIYLVLVIIITVIIRLLERRFKKSEKR